MATNRFPTPCVEWIPDCQLPMLRNPSFQWAHILDKTLLGNVGVLAAEGMRETDRVILKIMTE